MSQPWSHVGIPPVKKTRRYRLRMARRLFRFLLSSALLLVVVFLVRRTMHLRDEVLHVVASPDPWPPIAEVPPAPAWVDPVDGACPPGYPIKAKAASSLYHAPGAVNYERTKPDRCYAEESAAQADGFTRAKR